MNDPQHIDVSIVITTYNNKESLRYTLDSISDQGGLDGISYEVILVDNNSCDGTRDFVESYAREKNPNVKYLFEQKQGISFARNNGIKHVQGDIVAFTDDDCRLDKYWLKTLVETYEKHNPDAVQGKIDWGVVIPDDVFYPRWFLEERIAMVDYFDHVREFKDQNLVGANMSLRREVLEKSGGFSMDPLFSSNEDTELSNRITKMGFRKFYNPDLIVHHHFNTHRLNDKKLISQSYFFGRSSIKLEESNLVWQRHLLYCFKQIVLTIFRLIKFRFKNDRKNIFLAKCRLAGLRGCCVQLFRSNVLKKN